MTKRKEVLKIGRNKKAISQLSQERLRKLSPYEIQQRKEAEKQTREATKQKKITNRSIKKYLKSIVNDDCNLTDIEIILPYIQELHFIEELILSMKKDIIENGVIDPLRTVNPLIKEYNSLVKQKGTIIKEINSIINKRNGNTDNNNNDLSINDLMKILG